MKPQLVFKKPEWETGPVGNSVLKGYDFYVSYRKKNLGPKGFFNLDNEETALVRGMSFFILDGDHRKAYERYITKGFDACYAYYKRMSKKSHGKWSTDRPIEDLLADIIVEDK